MSVITLVNAIKPGRKASAEFRLSQGDTPIARIGVHAGGRATIPTTNSYTVQACTTQGLIRLESNPVSFDIRSANVLAQVRVENGFYDFQLALLPGTQASTIRCENTWIEPVTFNITMPGSPARIVSVVDEHNTKNLSTAQEWSCYAIVDGITTAPVMTRDPGATFVLLPDNNDQACRIVIR